MGVAAPNRKRSARGALTVLAMFALGGAVLCGLYLAPRGASPPSPGVPWGAPARTLRFVSFDCGGSPFERVRDAIDAIRGGDADFVMLEQVPAGEVLSFVEGLGLQQTYYTNLFERTGRRGRDETGCVVLSKHSLFDARPVLPEGRGGRSFGTWAVASVGGVRFAVGSVRVDGNERDAVARVWREAGSPPIVLGLGPGLGSGTPAGWTVAGRTDSSTLVTDGSWHAVGGGASTSPVTAGGAATVDLSGAAPNPAAPPATSH